MRNLPTAMRFFKPLFLFLLAWLAPARAGEPPPGPYTVGVVPQFDALRIHNVWQPILEAVQARTGLRLALRSSPTIQQFDKEYAAGTFDFVYVNPYLMVASRAQGYIPLVREQGSRLYGILVVRKDSPVHDLSDLQGETVAFPAPNALGASLLIRADLFDLFRVTVTPRYVKNHTSVYLNVVLGQAVAGGGVQKTLAEQPQEVRDALRVIYKTREVTPHPLAAHPRVPEPVRRQVQAALLALGDSAEGRALLAGVPIEVPGPADMADYEPLALMDLERFYVEE